MKFWKATLRTSKIVSVSSFFEDQQREGEDCRVFVERKNQIDIINE